MAVMKLRTLNYFFELNESNIINVYDLDLNLISFIESDNLIKDFSDFKCICKQWLSNFI